MSAASQTWHTIANVEEVPSPALLLYPDRIEENIRRMIALADGVSSLRPHVKTHKLPELVRMQMAQGISRFKTATIAETEMVASCGAAEVLLAYQPVGPNVRRLLELKRRFPATRLGALVDDPAALRHLADAFGPANLILDVWLDVDCGMHRTGIAPGPAAVELYQEMGRLPGINPTGLHAYDGHLHDSDPTLRQRRCEEAFAPVLQLQRALTSPGGPGPRLIAAGTPTFPCHARRSGVECSPGTCVLWDAGYSTKLPDLDFLHAALVLTRVVSRPGPDRLCLDLGHKAIASENPHPRVHFLGHPEAKAVMHSEEHLVIEMPGAARYAVGDCLYGVPWHICPTVALHAEAVTVKHGRAEARWQIRARQRSLTV
ncbi:MAG: D-TA family PLP-dependent enzyme [Verrucomicrobiota bacterium]